VRDTILFYRTNGLPVVEAFLPPQDVNDGIVYVVVLEGQAGDISTEGQKHFDGDVVVSVVSQKAGEKIDQKQILKDLKWINENPFLHSDLVYVPTEVRGVADVIYRISDRRPWRVYSGFENTGAFITDRDRVYAGFDWGNALGRGHLFSYRYTTDTNFSTSNNHFASYTAWFKEQRKVNIYAAYSKIDGNIAPPFTLEGSSVMFGFMITQKLPKIWDKYSHEFSVGPSYLKSDSDLGFGGTSAFASATKVVQMNMRYSGNRSDKYGGTSVSVEMRWNPGISASEVNYQNVVAGSETNYVYGIIDINRRTDLPHKFILTNQFSAQLSPELLQPSEQFGLGGLSSIRGYEQQEVSGDKGYLIQNDLLYPYTFSRDWGQERTVNGVLGVGVFFDYGMTWTTGVGDTILKSAGPRLSLDIPPYLTGRLDFGFQLKDSTVSPSGANKLLHLSLSLSY